MTPYLGSGAAMSIEDGVVLAQELRKDQSLLDAQLAFMARRLPRVRVIHELSTQAMLAEFDSVTPEALQRRLDYLAADEPIANEFSNRFLAHETYDQAVNSPRRELRIFDDPEGGTEHISIDNMPYVAGIIADWVAETFAG